MATLAEIRAKLKEQESRTGGSPSGGGDTAILKKARVQHSVSFLMVTTQTLSFGKNV